MAEIFSSTNPIPKFVKGAQNSRKNFEPLRNASVKTLRDDLKKIAKTEVEFSKSILKQIIPLDISIDKNAKGLRKLIPLNISLIDDEPAVKSNTEYDGVLYQENEAVLFE